MAAGQRRPTPTSSWASKSRTSGASRTRRRRSTSMGMESRPITKPGAKLITISAGDLFSQKQLSGLRPLRRSRPGHRGRRRSDAAVADRSRASKLITPTASAPSRRAAAKLAEANRTSPRARPRAGRLGLGRQPHQHRAPVRRAVDADQERRLVAGLRRRRSSAAGRTRLWDFNKHYQYIGGHGASGVGYGAPAAVGAALANRKHGRLSVNIQCDGDLNYAPGVLWTAAHHQHPAAERHAQQPRLSSGAHVPAGHGRARRTRHRSRATSAPPSPIRTSTTRRWRRLTACTAKARSTIPTISGPRSSAPSRW